VLGTILIGSAGFLVLFLVVVATRPSAYQVERKLAIAAPADLVFGLLNDLHQFAGVLVLFGSPVASCKLTIEESVPGQKLVVKLEFVEPMKSIAICAITLAGTPTGSVVTWSMEGNHNFIGKALGMFMDMDKMLGADIEKGLARLKKVAEGKQVSTVAVGVPHAHADADKAAAEA
jgi:hypothetical protein